MKEDISPISDALGKILGLTGVRYRWKDSTLGGYEYGLIAQDVARVAPELVFTMGGGMMGVKYDKAVGLIIEAIKEQQRQIWQTASGIVMLPRSEQTARVVFDTPFSAPPVISLSLYLASATDSAFMAESGRVAVTDVSTDGFTVIRDEMLPRDVWYMWTAIENNIKDSITIPIDTETPTPSPTLLPSVALAKEGTPTPTPPAQQNTITVLPNDLGFVRMREGPTIEASESGQIPSGTTLPYADVQFNWYQVTYEEKTGWISGTYVERN